MAMGKKLPIVSNDVIYLGVILSMLFGLSAGALMGLGIAGSKIFRRVARQQTNVAIHQAKTSRAQLAATTQANERTDKQAAQLLRATYVLAGATLGLFIATVVLVWVTARAR